MFFPLSWSEQKWMLLTCSDDNSPFSSENSYVGHTSKK